MTQSNVIVNGTFSQGNLGWNGVGSNDLETNFAESAYLGNGSTNAVAELDGVASQTTRMVQTVTIPDALTTELTFRSALRTASVGTKPAEGFRVEIFDSQGVLIQPAQTFFPTSTQWTDYSMSVTFPAGGDYTIRLTELGKNDSLGAIIDDVAMLVCFTAGTMIDTDAGPRAVETLRLGDLIQTQDAGLQPVRWIGQRRVEVPDLLADPSLRPIVFARNALGPGLPDRPLALSPQHRLCRADWRCELYFGHREVLVAAQSLVNGTTIRRADPVQAVTYVHFLLNGHQIVRSNGVASESFFPSSLALTGLERAAQAEVLRLFPDLESLKLAYPRTVRPVLRHHEARLVA